MGIFLLFYEIKMNFHEVEVGEVLSEIFTCYESDFNNYKCGLTGLKNSSGI
jgi:hypothetical protein